MLTTVYCVFHAAICYGIYNTVFSLILPRTNQHVYIKTSPCVNENSMRGCVERQMQHKASQVLYLSYDTPMSAVFFIQTSKGSALIILDARILIELTAVFVD